MKISRINVRKRGNVFQYKCSFFTLYFNEKLEPITYGNQSVIDNKVYYDMSSFVEGDDNRADCILGFADWENQKGWGN